MQFLENGPDIPPELLEAQERGDVVFVCGAGVSRGVGLPSFRGLVDNIYRALGETWRGQAAEEPFVEGTQPSLDRALFALQTRMGGTDPRKAAHTRRQIADAVQGSLAPPVGVQLPDHLNLLKLSRDGDMRPRLVTTNFDPLFERAWCDDGRSDLPSRAVADMPGPGSPDFFGVLHLHGRIADAALGLARTDLVLNSAEFGEAYLRSAWASRYVYDLARASTIVMVGYGAEDPPVRYLLEVLSADRTRFRDLQDIYAFTPHGAFGDREAIETRLRAQGIIPLAYEAPAATDHANLYASLAAWADYAENPTAWRRRKAQEIMDRAPDSLTPPDWVSLRWALGRGDAPRILSGANPDARWLAPLKADGLLARARPAGWIERRMAEADMLAAAIERDILDLETAEDLTISLTRAGLPEALDRAWRLLLRNRSVRPRWDDGWFETRRRIRAGDAGLDVRRQVVGLFAPRAVAKPVFRWPEAVRSESDPRLMDVGYGGPLHVDASELVDLWPPAQDGVLLRALVRALEDALEEAADHGFTGGHFDRASFQVKSVSQHPQDSLREGFYPIVRGVAGLLERLAGPDPAQARRCAESLRDMPYGLSRRLFLHALSLQEVFTADEVADVLLRLGDDVFWASEPRREIMRLTAERWVEFADVDRAALEARLIAGPPRGLFVDDEDMAEQIAGVTQRETFLRLARQERVGTGLGPDAAARVAELRAEHPRWEREVDERADFPNWSEMAFGLQGEPSLLDKVVDDELVERAVAIAEADPWGQGEIWRKFVAAEPTRAFEGLLTRSQDGDWPIEAWIPYFWGLADVDDPELERRTVETLNAARLQDIQGFGFAVSSWFVRRDGLAAVDAAARLQLWDRLTEIMIADEREAEGGDADRSFDVLNRTSGHLARQLVKEIKAFGIVAEQGLSAPFQARLERLLGLDGNRGAIAAAALGRGLPYLHAVDPAWAEAHLTPLFAVDHPWAPAMWTQLAATATWPEALFAVLRPDFLATFAAPQRFEPANENLVFHLLRMARDRTIGTAPGPWPVDAEAKAALASSNAEFRRQAAFRLFRAMEDTEEADRPRAWRETFGPLFRAIWPMAPGQQSSDTTYYLTGMALRTGEAFAEAVDLVSPALLGAGRDDRDAFGMLRDEHEALLLAYPDAALTLFDALVDRAVPPRDLAAWLEQLVAAQPNIRTDMRFERLLGIARRAQA